MNHFYNYSVKSTYVAFLDLNLNSHKLNLFAIRITLQFEVPNWGDKVQDMNFYANVYVYFNRLE